MITANARIRTGEDFKRIFKAGVRVRSEHLMAHSLKDTDDSHASRVGFIVSKAVGNAVTRNRVKRRLREIVRPMLTEFEPGTLLVLRALPEAAGADYTQLHAEVVELVERANRKSARRGQRA